MTQSVQLPGSLRTDGCGMQLAGRKKKGTFPSPHQKTKEQDSLLFAKALILAFCAALFRDLQWSESRVKGDGSKHDKCSSRPVFATSGTLSKRN